MLTVLELLAETVCIDNLFNSSGELAMTCKTQAKYFSLFIRNLMAFAFSDISNKIKTKFVKIFMLQ